MDKSYRVKGPRAVRAFKCASAFLVPALLLVAVPLIREGFSWSNLSIFVGMGVACGVSLLQLHALAAIHESDKAARAAGDEPIYLVRLLGDEGANGTKSSSRHPRNED